MAENVLKDALKEAKLLREGAVEVAKNQLVEAISPNVDKFISERLGDVSESDYQLEMGAEDDMDLEAESMSLPEAEDYEAPEEESEGLEMEAKESDDEDLEETKDYDDDMDEVVDLTQEDFSQAFNEALKEMQQELKTEANVTKGFGDPQDATLKVSGGKEEKGIADDDTSSEKPWEEKMPPDMKDWSVKEAKYKKALNGLNSQLNEYKKAYGELRNVLKEVYLFNTKLVYTNKLLQNESLSNKMKKSIIETMDNASTAKEAEIAYKAIHESLKMTKSLTESKRNKSSKYSKASRTMKSVLSESARNGEEENSETARWQHLAGLLE